MIVRRRGTCELIRRERHIGARFEVGDERELSWEWGDYCPVGQVTCVIGQQALSTAHLQCPISL